jgi:hypothetical protein
LAVYSLQEKHPGGGRVQGKTVEGDSLQEKHIVNGSECTEKAESDARCGKKPVTRYQVTITGDAK